MLQQIMSVCATVASFSIVLIVFIVWAMILWQISKSIVNGLFGVYLYLKFRLRFNKEQRKAEKESIERGRT